MNSAAPLPPVAVIGVDSPIGLALVRELGGHGVPVYALGKGAGAIGGKSRFVHRFDVIPGPLADWLPGHVARHGIGAVMAVSEHHLIELAALKDRLSPAKVLCPDAEKLALVLDKQATLAVAARLGMDVPASWQPMAGEDRAARLETLVYPVAVKWADPNAVSARLAAAGLPLEKVEYAADAAALAAILARYDRLGEWPLVQTWCAGEGLGQMLHMRDGRATLRFQHRRLREWPPSGGVSSFCAAEPPEAHAAQMAKSERLLSAMGWEGPAMVEYRHDPATGRYWLMEINGRFWGSIPLASACGAQFGWETYCAAVLGGSGAAQPAPKVRKARYAIPDGKHIVAVLRDGSLPLSRRLARAGRWLADFLDPSVRWYVWQWRDPGPLLADLRAIVRKLR